MLILYNLHGQTRLFDRETDREPRHAVAEDLRERRGSPSAQI
jgi:hypothetical protein